MKYGKSDDVGKLFVFTGLSEAAAGWQGGRASVLVLASIIPELPVLPGCVSLWGQQRDGGQHPGEGTDLRGERRAPELAAACEL